MTRQESEGKLVHASVVLRGLVLDLFQLRARILSTCNMDLYRITLEINGETLIFSNPDVGCLQIDA